MKFCVNDAWTKKSFENLIGNYGFTIDENGLKTEIIVMPELNHTVKLEYASNKLNVTVKTANKILWALKEFSDLFTDKMPDDGYTKTFDAKFNDLNYMLDCSRNAVYEVKTLKRFISQLAVLGYDSFMLYTEDTYKVKEYPYFGYLRGSYTEEDIKEVDAFCQNFGIELVPCIQTLGHFNSIVRYPAMDHLFDIVDILMVGEDATYDFIESMIKTCANCFKSRRINIGMDEAYWLGRGRYLDKHGLEKRFDIMKKHLAKVVEICNKYGFKPMMWSDMFFGYVIGSQNNDGNVSYQGIVPEEVSLIYWDYYHTDENYYNEMMKKHRVFDNEIVFATGAWKWLGFTPDNRYSFVCMRESCKACVKNGIGQYIVTAWGDNGAETSCFAILPAVFYAAYINFHGYAIDAKFRKAFKTFSGMNLNDFMAIDLANRITKNDDVEEKNSANKYLLYNDILLGTLDTIIVEGQGDLYKEHAKTLKNVAKRAGDWAYIFKTQEALCKVLSIKTELGVKLRTAYQNGNNEELKLLLQDLKKLYKAVDEFYLVFLNQWTNEARPHGFDVQDIRIGALKQRIIAAERKVEDYLSGKTDAIPELNEKLLCFMGHGDDFEKDLDQCEYRWRRMTSVNVND